MALPLANFQNGYGWISISLHWVSFLLAAFLLGEGLYMVRLTYYDPLYHSLPEWHKLAGIVLAIITASRIVWILLSPPPKPLGVIAWKNVMAKGAHILLYGMLVGLPVTGFFLTTADGRPMKVFDVTLLPAYAELSSAWVDWPGIVHRWLAYATLTLVLVHSFAALKHHYWNKDATLRRMLFPLKCE